MKKRVKTVSAQSGERTGGGIFGQEEEARLEEDESETRKKLKANREHHKAWEGNREKRIGSWREFAKKKPKKAKTGIKPPKLKVTAGLGAGATHRAAGQLDHRLLPRLLSATSLCLLSPRLDA